MKKNNLNNLFKDKDFYKDLSILKDLLSSLELRRDLLIEHLHIIQDHFGFLSEKNLILLAKLVNISSVEVYEVASFYAHFDIVKDGELAPPKTTIRVCNSLSCELFGSKELESNLAKNYKGQDVRVLKAPCMGRCSSAPVLEIGHYHIENASLEKVDKAIRFLPRPADYLFVYLLSFYVLLISVKVEQKFAVIGAFAFAFSTYLIIILGVGHNTKALAIGYAPLAIAGVYNLFEKKYLVGFILATLGFGLQINANHYQMTYYFVMLSGLLALIHLFN